MSKRGADDLKAALGRIEGVAVMNFGNTGKWKRRAGSPVVVISRADDAVERSRRASPQRGYLVLGSGAGKTAHLLAAFESLMEIRKTVGEEKTVRLIKELADSVQRRPAPRPAAEPTDEERWRALREDYLRRRKGVTAPELARITGSRAANASARAHAWKKAGRIFSVNDGAAEIFPLFQLKHGRPREVIADVLARLGTRMSPWEMALWFEKPHVDLGGWKSPLDLLDDDPDAVRRAAEADAQESVY